MGILKQIRRHAAVASGDFGAMFKGIEIPPLPLALNRLLSEINKRDPDLDYIVKLISSETGIAAKVMQTVNSAFYGFRSPVSDIKRAIMLMGLKNIRSLALAYGTMAALPKPKGDLFDHEAFWNDSLLRALLSRGFAEQTFKYQADEAFTVSLLADVAVPVLLCMWSDYYEPIMQTWLNSTQRLSQIEREHFGWDHAQAGAWIFQSWGFPEEMICFMGAHTLSIPELVKSGLDQTLAMPISIAAHCTSVLRPDSTRAALIAKLAFEHLDFSPGVFISKINEIETAVNEVIEVFELSNRGVGESLSQLVTASELVDQGALA